MSATENEMSLPVRRPVHREVPIVYHQTSVNASESTTVVLQTLQANSPDHIMHAMSSQTQMFLDKKRSRSEAEVDAPDKPDAPDNDSTDRFQGPKSKCPSDWSKITFRATGGMLDFFIFYGPTYEDVVRQY